MKGWNKGKVQSSRKDKTAIKVNDAWHDFKGDALIEAKKIELFNKTISYEIENNKIISFQVLKDVQELGLLMPKVKNYDDERQKKIIRQNSLTQAGKHIENLINNKLINENVTSDKIESLYFQFAEKCEDWINRDHASPKKFSKQTVEKATNDNKLGEGEGGLITSFPPSKFIPTEEMIENHAEFLTVKPLGDTFTRKDYVSHMVHAKDMKEEEAGRLFDHKYGEDA